MASLQFDLSTVASVASISPGPDPEHVGGPWLQPLHRHHVGAGLQNGVVLLPLVLVQCIVKNDILLTSLSNLLKHFVNNAVERQESILMFKGILPFIEFLDFFFLWPLQHL